VALLVSGGQPGLPQQLLQRSVVDALHVFVGLHRLLESTLLVQLLGERVQPIDLSLQLGYGCRSRHVGGRWEPRRQL
jgi:hypothetical protein